MMIFVFVGVVLFVAAIDTSDWFMDEETEYLLYTCLLYTSRCV